MKRTLEMESQILEISTHASHVPHISIAHNEFLKTAQHLENSLANSAAAGGPGGLGHGQAGRGGWSSDQLSNNVNISLPIASHMDQSLSMSLSPGNSLEIGNSRSMVYANDEEPGDARSNRPMADCIDNVASTGYDSIGGSPGSNPQTALMDIPREDDNEYDANMHQGNEFGGNSASAQDRAPTQDAQIAQFSRTNVENHYFRQTNTPFVPPGSALQTRLIDAYVEYDEINATHFSPARKNPAAGKELALRHAHMIAVTSERMKGYATEAQEQKMRQTYAAEAAAQKVARAVQHNYPNRLREQGKRQIMRIEAARVDGRPEPKVVEGVGKLVPENKHINSIYYDAVNGGNRALGFGVTGVGLHNGQSIEQVKASHPILHFEKSLLNQELLVPAINADGTDNHQPRDPRIIDQLELQRLENLERLEQVCSVRYFRCPMPYSVCLM